MNKKWCKINLYIMLCFLCIFFVAIFLWHNGNHFLNSLSDNNSKEVANLLVANSRTNSDDTQRVIESITQVTTHAISTTTLIINALAAIMTGISLVSVVITIIAAIQLKDIQKKMEIIETTEKEVKGVKSTQHIISGIIYKKSEKYDYAIEEFEKAIDLCENDGECLMRVNSELGHVYIELYTEFHNDKHFEKAEEYLKKSLEYKHKDMFYAESNFALGALYGLKAESIGEVTSPTFIEYLEKSEKYLKEAIKTRNSSDYNRNIAVTYGLMNETKKTIKYLERAIDILEEKFAIPDSKTRVLKVFSTNERKLIGKKNWCKIEDAIKNYK